MPYDDLARLVRQTYLLWDPGWVTFNWRGYTYDHVRRVAGLSLTLCRALGGDERVTHLAALLHDITKPYDGEYLTDADGRRLVDERGYWRNEMRQPPRANRVTALYERLGLSGQLHNESGSVLAAALLRERRMQEETCERVARAIRNHLLPPEDADLPSRCLYDADTIDANIGLPAFVRNIYINEHFHDRRRPDGTPSLQVILAEDPLAYLRPYVLEKLPAWVEGKQRDFIPRLLTPAAREIATARIERLARAIDGMRRDLGQWGSIGHRGTLDLILHYMRPRPDPSMADETTLLRTQWREETVDAEALALLGDIETEMRGDF